MMSSSNITVPTLTALMQPQTGIALDIPPYNIFTLRCVASVPDTVLLQKSFEWRNGGNVIGDNGNTVLISHHNNSKPQSISELTVNGLSVGSHTYFCSVSMLVPGGDTLVAHTSGSVTIQGRSFTVNHHNHNVYLCLF